MPKKKPEFIRFTTVKEYIKNVLKMRSSDGAVKKLVKDFDATIVDVMAEAKRLAEKDNRSTIMEQDVIPALEKYLGRRHLTWQETAEEVILKNPTDLGKISRAINDYIAKEQEAEQSRQFRRIKR